MRVQELRVIVEAVAGRQARGGRWIVSIDARHHAEEDRRVADGPRERSRRVLVGSDRDDPVAADQADGGLDANEHVCGAGTQNRSRSFGADADGRQIRRNSDARARARSAGREHGTSVVERTAERVRRVPRIGSRIVRVVAVAAERAVAGRHPVGQEVRELRHRRLAEDDRAGAEQLPRDERIGPRNGSGKGDRTGRRRHLLRIDVVLEDDRNAEQGTLVVFAVVVLSRFSRVANRVLVDVDVRVEMRGGRLCVVGRDPVQVHPHELLRRDDAIVNRLLNRRDRRFDQIESPGTVPVVGADAAADRHERDRRDDAAAAKQNAKSFHAEPPCGGGSRRTARALSTRVSRFFRNDAPTRRTAFSASAASSGADFRVDFMSAGAAVWRPSGRARGRCRPSLARPPGLRRPAPAPACPLR